MICGLKSIQRSEMGNFPRYIPEGWLVEVTTRTIQGRLLLVPSRDLARDRDREFLSPTQRAAALESRRGRAGSRNSSVRSGANSESSLASAGSQLHWASARLWGVPPGRRARTSTIGEGHLHPSLLS